MKVFFSYSHRDEALRNELDIHFSMLKRNGDIEVWHDRQILGGEKFDEKIRFELEHADLIILLISPHFLNSEYCYSTEMSRAIVRAEEGSAFILPVIAEVCDWHNSPISDFKAVPLDGKPLSKYANINEGFMEVVKEIRSIMRAKFDQPNARPRLTPKSDEGIVDAPLIRSSNLQIRREFNAADKDEFLFEAFDYVSKFFEGSLAELKNRNSDIQTTFRKIDQNRFTCQIYRHGASINQCQISLQTMLSRTFSIYYSYDFRDNSYQEILSVKDDGQVMYLEASMGRLGGASAGQLTKEGASEYLWSILIEPLQR